MDTNKDSITEEEKSFFKELMRYYMDFLETDFHRHSLPKRIVHLRDNNGHLLGINLMKYEKFQDYLRKIFVKKNTTLKFEIKRDQYKSRIKTILKNFIDETIDKLQEKTVKDLIASSISELKKIRVDNVDNYNASYEGAIEVIRKEILKKIIQPLSSILEKPLTEERSLGIETIFELEDDLLDLLSKDVNESIDKPLIDFFSNGKMEELKNFLSDVLSLSILTHKLHVFFENFTFCDLFFELNEIFENKRLNEKNDFYLYFCDINFNKRNYPLFYFPMKVLKEVDVFDITIEPYVLINKKAIEYIVQEYNNNTKKIGNINACQERIVYLSQDEKTVVEYLQPIISDLARHFSFSEDMDISESKTIKRKSLLLNMTNDLHFCLCDNSDESLLNDYEELQTLLNSKNNSLARIFVDFLKSFILEDPISCRDTIDMEWENKDIAERLVYDSPIPLNEEQRKILNALKLKDCRCISVQGPPGTGKSHTITAVAFDAIMKDHSVLILSDKKEALDVVEDKITNALNKIRSSEGFQNPILRLDKPNFGRIMTSTSLMKIRDYHKVIKQSAEEINTELCRDKKELLNKIEKTIEYYKKINIKELQEFCNLETIIEKTIGVQNIDQINLISPILSSLKSFFECLKRLYDDKEVIFLLNYLSDRCYFWSDAGVEEAIQKFKEYYKKIDIKELWEYFNLENLIEQKIGIQNIEQIKLIFTVLPSLKSFFECLKKLYDDKEVVFLLNYLADRCCFWSDESVKEEIQKFKLIFAECDKCKLKHFGILFDRSGKTLSDIRDILDQYYTLSKRFFKFLYKKDILALENKLKDILRLKEPVILLQEAHLLDVAIAAVRETKELAKKHEISKKEIHKFYEFSIANPNFSYTDLLFKISGILEISRVDLSWTKDILTKIGIDISFSGTKNKESIESSLERVNLIQKYWEKQIAVRETKELAKKHGISKKEVHKFYEFFLMNPNFSYTDLFFKISDILAISRTNVSEIKNILTKIGIDISFSGTKNKESIESSLERVNLIQKYWEKQIGYNMMFNSIPEMYYVSDCEKMAELQTIRMASLIDGRVLDFYENNRNTAQMLKKIISKKQKFPRAEFEKIKKAFPCIIAGIRDYAEYIPLGEEVFDLVIIDEASQVSIAQAFPAILRAKKILVLGDSKQFSNVKTSNASKIINTRYMDKLSELFKSNISREQVQLERMKQFDIRTSILEFFDYISNYNVMLRKHFRGYREIISFSSKYFYDGQLQAIKVRGKPIDDVLRFTVLTHDEKLETPQEANTNPFETEFIVKELERFISEQTYVSVGIITPFTSQQKFIVDAVKRSKFAEDIYSRLKLKVMTFDSCQGEERDIIFYSMVASQVSDRTNYIFASDLELANDDEKKIRLQRLNVGFSRAKECMHFVLSKPISEFSGSIGTALFFYENQLSYAKKLPSKNDVDPSSPMEEKVLSWIQDAQFYQNNQTCFSIQAQFPIGDYLKQLDPMYNHPRYRCDFFVQYRDEKQSQNIVIEYDGFKEHFTNLSEVNHLNYESYYKSSDIEREKILEAYGCKFIRINRFNLGKNPVDTISKRLENIVKKKSLEHPFH